MREAALRQVGLDGYMRRVPFLIALLLSIHAGLLAYVSYRDSATWDEVGHFGAGLSHWCRGTFNLYRVNPPLVRLVGCGPVAWTNPGIELGSDGLVGFPFYRADFRSGQGVAESLGAKYFWLLTLARWACIPFSIFGGWVCYLWARDLYGRAAGLLAATLWVFCPNVLAYGHLITPDMGAAGLGVGAAYLFWKWLAAPAWPRALVTGLVLGLAELTKTTWVVLFVLWPVVWLTSRGLERREGRSFKWRQEGLQIGVLLVIALWVLNLGYGFERSFQRLGDYNFASQALGGSSEVVQNGQVLRNRFAGSWLGHVPVPVPENYLLGIDYVKMEYERKDWSYLRGEWRLGGWWYYYLYALLVKVPVGTWVMLVIAAIVTLFRKGYSARFRDELVVLAPAAIVLALVSSQTGFNHHLRYVLPIFPFAFIWISKVARSVRLGHRWTEGAAGVALCGSVASSLWVYPHSMSYFNEFVGGPKNGHYHLGNSNADWGQDLFYLKDWVEAHPEAKPLYLVYDLPLIDPRMVGIEWERPPVGPNSPRARELEGQEARLQPGWYVISVNELHGSSYDYFLPLKPVDRIGYSMCVYHVTPEDARRLRWRYPTTSPVGSGGEKR